MFYSDICAIYELQIDNYFYEYKKDMRFSYHGLHGVTHYHRLPLMFRNDFKVWDQF